MSPARPVLQDAERALTAQSNHAEALIGECEQQRLKEVRNSHVTEGNRHVTAVPQGGVSLAASGM